MEFLQFLFYKGKLSWEGILRQDLFDHFMVLSIGLLIENSFNAVTVFLQHYCKRCVRGHLVKGLMHHRPSQWILSILPGVLFKSLQTTEKVKQSWEVTSLIHHVCPHWSEFHKSIYWSVTAKKKWEKGKMVNLWVFFFPLTILNSKTEHHILQVLIHYNGWGREYDEWRTSGDVGNIPPEHICAMQK